MLINSRTSKSIQNVKVALFFYFFNLLLQFFSRKIFLDYLGSEILGLNTTTQNLLGFLNLAELGIGSAVAYHLYKPLFERNQKVINEIVSIQGWFYRRVACVVLSGACILMCFFPWIFSKAQIPLAYVYGSFLVALIASLLSYFINYRQIVLSADQQQYRIITSTQSIGIAKVILQILAIRFFDYGYVWWLALELFMAFVSSYALDCCVRKTYPWLRAKPSDGSMLQKQYPGIIVQTKQVFFHLIASYVLTQTSPLIIYAYTSLTLVAVYGNYLLIVNGVTKLLNALFNSISAGIGNLVAEGDQQRIKLVFWELTVMRMWLASVACFGMYRLGGAFIALWLGEEYLLPWSAFIVLIGITFILLSRINDIFISAYGLYQDIWAAITEVILNLGLSILLGYYWGLTGILLGVFISLLIIVCCWKPYFLYKYGFKEDINEYVMRYFKIFCVLGIAWYLSNFFIDYYINLSYTDYKSYFFLSFVVIGIYILISLILLCLSDKVPLLFFKRFRGVLKW